MAKIQKIKKEKHMGTRIDYYIGVGQEAEWIGSETHNGFFIEEEKDHPIHLATTAEDFKKAVHAKMNESPQCSKWPKDGWPWSWDTSDTTDVVCCFYEGQVKVFQFDEKRAIEWPDMSAIKNVTDAGFVMLREL